MFVSVVSGLKLVFTVNTTIKYEQLKNDEVSYTALLILNILQARMNDHFFLNIFVPYTPIMENQ